MRDGILLVIISVRRLLSAVFFIFVVWMVRIFIWWYSGVVIIIGKSPSGRGNV